MKAIPFNIPKVDNSAIHVQLDSGSAFYDKLHFHTEYQITTIIKGEGVIYVGSNFVQFAVGDVIIIGSEVAHLIKNTQRENQEILAHSVFFRREAFGANFFALAELTEIHSFLQKSERGIIIKKNNAIELCRIISQFQQLKGWQLVSNLILLLGTISRNSHLNYLNPPEFNFTKDKSNLEKLNRIFDYTLQHLEDDIKIAEVAQQINLSESQFSRYFKMSTRKTYIQFLNELRIESACSLLRTKDMTIEVIANNSGFNNISHFNDTFKKIKGKTPRAYRKELMTII